MTTINQTSLFETEIPKEFDTFLEYFDTWIQGQKSAMRHFLWVNSPIHIIYKDLPTFAFQPNTKNIIIPLSFLKVFHRNITQNKPWNPFLYSFEDLKMGIYHELSHFRDMLHEKDSKKRWAMIQILKHIQKEKIMINANKYIPIANQMHDLVNCVDDIIVNTEVEMNLQAEISREYMQGVYIYNLFADVYEENWWDYRVSKEWGIEYVWEGNGTHRINDKGEIDYSSKQLSQAFPNFLLRSFMVKSQSIKLPEKVENILFSNKHRRARPSWKISIQRQVWQMKAYFNEIENNPQYTKRVQKLKPEYMQIIEILEKAKDNEQLENLLSQSIKNTNTTRRFYEKTINLIDIIRLFTLSSGKENSHELDISPWMRYEIYKALFLPLQKSFILMDLLTKDIKDSNKKWENGEWKNGKWENGEWEKGKWENGKWEDDKPWDENQEKEPQDAWSGNGPVHESPDIDEKIKFLEEVDKEENKKEQEELAKKQVEKSQYDVDSIFDGSGVWKVWKDIFEHISHKYNEYIKEIVEFFIKELAKLERKEIREEYSGKKWTLDPQKLRSYIAQDPSMSQIDTKKLYKRYNYREKIAETLKKIDLTLAIDISGSTNSFRGKDGMINIISTLLFVAMKHIEQHINHTLWIPDYTIPVEFLLYGDGTPYSSYHSEHKNSSNEVRIAEMNEKLISLDGGTNDTTAWEKISHEFNAQLSQDPEYTQEIKDHKRRPIILQIADSDVSENGVESIKKVMKKHLQDDALIDSLPIKRIILWNIQNINISQQEYEARKKMWELWNWEPNFLPDGSVQLKQISIKSRDEILGQIKALFKNFFVDMKENI